ncbi:Spy/CpxP family protein refolding chaperone [Roseomonas chloroacetimidivorans]|uniref:Spy/CpxP family protein refolding chaperone n=1 Tax=Roseomonas chloroacetimidivorans TaxID=1766656 RepID=UPI003C74E5FF
MSKQRSLPTAATLAVLVPLSSLAARAELPELPLQLAMMDMMPMGGGGAHQEAGGMRMGDDMRMQPMQAPQMQGGAGTGAMPGMSQPGPAQQLGANQTPPQPAPSAGMGSGGVMDDSMSMGGAMAAQGQMPMLSMGQGTTAGCPMMPMMPMMQNMMRMGAPQMGMTPVQGGSMPTGSSAARLEGRIAFLRTELRITDAQASAWDGFANTLRAGREHLDAARSALRDSTTAVDPLRRLEAFETHLRQRTEAIHTTRMAFTTLYAQLDDAQKRVATATMLPFIGTF